MGDNLNKDYGVLFRDIVAPHLHKIVSLVSGSKVKKILLHEWVLGVEHNWAEYFVDSEVDSEFIPRLSFRIGGLRDEFKNGSSEEEISELLIETFVISTLAYFEFGARLEIFWEIDKFCKKVDEWMRRDILKDKFKKFKLMKESIPLINNSINLLKHIDPALKIRVGIKKNLTTSSEMEQEFIKILHKVVELFIEYEKKIDDRFEELDKELTHLISRLEDIGYNKILTKTQEEEIEKLQKEHKDKKEREWRERVEREQKEREEMRKLQEELKAKSLFERRKKKISEKKEREDIEKKKAEREQKEHEEKKNNIQDYTTHKSLIAIGVCVMVLAIVLIISIQPLPQQTTKILFKNITTYVDVPINVSIAKYTGTFDRTYVENVSIVGYLRQEIQQTDANTKIIKNYIIDDYGNMVELSLGYSASQKYNSLFISNTTSLNTYRITGILRYKYDRFAIDVDSITQEDRLTIRSAKITQENVTESQNITNSVLNITYGIKRILG